VKTLLMAVSVALLALGAACSDSDGPTDPDGPTTGTIAVSATTTGDDQDINGYLVMLDGAERAAIGANGSVNLSEVSPGGRSVSLSGVAENCAVGGEHPRSVSVTAGATSQEAFGVSCVAAIGSIQVTVTTTGDGLNATDPDGYLVSVDGDEAQPIDANATLLLSVVRAGTRRVELSGVATNCSAEWPNPRNVFVPLDGTGQVAFDVACTEPPPGTIAFGSVRTGRDEVFTMSGAGASVTQITNSPEEGGPRVAIRLSPDGSKIAYLAELGADWDIWVVNTDGSGQLRLTDNSEGTNTFSWSPDGLHIAFGRRIISDQNCDAFDMQCGIEVVTVDGTSQVTLSDMRFAGDPVWSPDGAKILFLVWDFDTGERHIWRVNTDGTGLEQFTNSGFYSHVAYSPDGTQILFTIAPEIGMQGSMGVMNADGSGATLLAEGDSPRWSPDGSRIAFSTRGEGATCSEWAHLNVMDSDGTGMIALTEGFCVEEWAWSPDGRWLAFDSYPGHEIHIVATDGSAEPVNITNHGAEDWLGSWGP